MRFLGWGSRARTPPMIGVDVSSSSLKLVELGRDDSGQFVLERLASQPLEGGLVIDGQIERFDEVADAVRRLVAVGFGTMAFNMEEVLLEPFGGDT